MYDSQFFDDIVRADAIGHIIQYLLAQKKRNYECNYDIKALLMFLLLFTKMPAFFYDIITIPICIYLN